MADVKSILDRLYSRSKTHTYVILDAARNKTIYPALRECEEEYQCLYAGKINPRLAEAAPYLLKLKKESSFPQWLVEKGWGDSWGIFMQSAETLAQVRRHFRRFLMVLSPNNKRMYFRYYDPRVFRAYLPTCNYDELKTVFGPVRSFLVEADDPKILIDYQMKEMNLEWKFINPTTQQTLETRKTAYVYDPKKPLVLE